MVSCKLIALESREGAAVLCSRNEIPYKALTIDGKPCQLKIAIEEVRENKYGKLITGYIDRVLTLYDREKGVFRVRVSDRLELQIYEVEDPVLLGIFAKRDLSANIASSLEQVIGLLHVYLDLTANFDKIKEHPRFQDVRQLRLSNIRDLYLDKAVLIGRELHKSPYAKAVRVRLGAALNAVAIVYRNTWVLVTRDARIYTPVPERLLPGGREGFILDLYRELKSLSVVQVQKILT